MVAVSSQSGARANAQASTPSWAGVFHLTRSTDCCILTGPKPKEIKVETFRINYLIRSPKVEKLGFEPVSMYTKAEDFAVQK